ncbi:uncharacterized protein HaLaN_04512, partial [Haematococcus lacustris]
MTQGRTDARTLKELGEMVKLVQAEQEGFASNAAMAAQLRSPGGAGSSGGGSDGSAMALMLGSEERLQRSLQQVKDLVNANIAELDGAKAKYDTSLELVQVTFQQLHTRLAALESSSGSDSDSRLSSWARASELRELENSFIDRLRMTSDANERMQRTINQLVVDMERVAAQHNNSEHARANAASAASGARGGSLNAEQLGLMEQRVEQRLALMATQFASVHSLRECEARFASLDTIRSLQDTARANDELVLGAVKQLERQFQEKIDVEHQVLLRMARQVDTLQREIRSHTEAPQAEVTTPQLRLVRPLASPTGTMGFNPLTNAMGDRSQDPMSILLAQANGMSHLLPPHTPRHPAALTLSPGWPAIHGQSKAALSHRLPNSAGEQLGEAVGKASLQLVTHIVHSDAAVRIARYSVELGAEVRVALRQVRDDRVLSWDLLEGLLAIRKPPPTAQAGRRAAPPPLKTARPRPPLTPQRPHPSSRGAAYTSLRSM